MIERARLDGSGRQVVLAQTERVQWPNHMIINDEYVLVINRSYFIEGYLAVVTYVLHRNGVPCLLNTLVSCLVFSWLYFVDGKRHQLVMCMKDGSSDAVDVTGMTAVTNDDPVFGLAYDVSRSN